MTFQGSEANLGMVKSAHEGKGEPMETREPMEPIPTDPAPTAEAPPRRRDRRPHGTSTPAIKSLKRGRTRFAPLVLAGDVSFVIHRMDHRWETHERPMWYGVRVTGPETGHSKHGGTTITPLTAYGEKGSLRPLEQECFLVRIHFLHR
jgi:hypothetical protein